METNKTKKCKECQSDIPAGAKRCPNCRADQRNWFLRHKILTGLAVIIILIIIAAVAGSNSNNPTKVGTNGQPVQSAQQTFKVGDHVQMGSDIITVNSANFSNGTEFMKPSAGNTWLDVNLTIQNNDNTQQYITTLGQMFVKDSDGNSYNVSPTDKELSNPSLGMDGPILANSKKTAWVGFEVKQGAKGLQFEYQASMFGGKTAVIDLGM